MLSIRQLFRSFSEGERVHRVLAVRIPARETGCDVHAREFEAMHGEARDLLVREAQADRDAVETAARADQASRLGKVVFLQHADLRETLQRGVDVWQRHRREQAEARRMILNQFCAVLVTGARQTARRRGVAEP